MTDIYNEWIDFSFVDLDTKNIVIALVNKLTTDNPECGDFRPLSLLSLPSFKCLERILKSKLNLPRNGTAFGYKESNSTNDMIFLLLETLRKCKSE
jgi:hypothetical protein